MVVKGCVYFIVFISVFGVLGLVVLLLVGVGLYGVLVFLVV